MGGVLGGSSSTVLVCSGPGVCSGLLHGMYSVSPAPCPPSIHPPWPARLRAACVGCTWRWGHPPCAGAHPCLSVFRQDSLGRLLCVWCACLPPQMTSETVISLSSRLWDVIFASFKTDYATMEAVRKTFPRVENHTLAFWGGLVSAGDEESQELMKHLVENRLVRASLTNSARLGESCALHAEGVASRYRPFMSPTICFLSVCGLGMVRC